MSRSCDHCQSLQSNLRHLWERRLGNDDEQLWLVEMENCSVQSSGRMYDKRIKAFIMKKKRSDFLKERLRLRRWDWLWFHHNVPLPLKSSSTGSPIHDDDISVFVFELWLKSNLFLASLIVTAGPPQSLYTTLTKKNLVDHVKSENNSIFCVINESDKLNCGY